MEKKIDKKKIVKYAASGLLTATITIGTGLHIYDSNIDHLNEYCSLNTVLGVEHQINEINDEFGVYGTRAFYAENGEVQVISDAIKTVVGGKEVYIPPVGYVLVGEKAVKTIRYAADDAIVVTQGIPVYPEDAQPGDFIKKSDIEIYDPQVVNIIEKPKSTLKSESTVSEHVQPKTAVVVVPDEVLADSSIETIPEGIDSSIYEYAIANDVRIVLSLEDNNYYVWHPTQYYSLKHTAQEDGSLKYTAIGADRVVIDAQSGMVYAAKTSELELFDLQLLNNQSR